MPSLEEENLVIQPDVATKLDASEISALLKASKSNSFVPSEKKVETNDTFYRKTLAEIASIADKGDQLLENEAVENLGAEKQIEPGEGAINDAFENLDPLEFSTDQADSLIEFNDSNFDKPTTLSEKSEELIENHGNIPVSNPMDLEKIANLEKKLRDLEADFEHTKLTQNELDKYLTLLKDVCVKLPPLSNAAYDDFENEIMHFLRDIISDRLGYEISGFPEKIAEKIANKLSDLYQVGSRVVIKMNASDATMLEKEFSKFTNITIKTDDSYLTGDYSISLGSLVLEDKLRMPLKDFKGNDITNENP